MLLSYFALSLAIPINVFYLLWLSVCIYTSPGASESISSSGRSLARDGARVSSPLYHNHNVCV